MFADPDAMFGTRFTDQKAGSRQHLSGGHLGTTNMLKAYFLLSLVFVAVVDGESHAKLQSGSAASCPAVIKPIRLILSDVDGTLMDRAGTFYDPNVTALSLARTLGIQVAFATGRPKSNVLELIGEDKLRETGFDGNPGVYLNGSYVVGPKGEILRDEPLKPEVLNHVLNVFEQEGVLDSAVGVGAGGFVYYSGSKGQLQQQIHKLHVEGEPKVISRLRRRLEAELGSKIGFAQSHARAFEVITPGFDKGDALILLCAELGISPDEVLALGNAPNDLPMFAVAGASVAVGDAYEIAKEAADCVTVKHTEGALFEVVREIMRLGLYPNHQPVI